MERNPGGASNDRRRACGQYVYSITPDLILEYVQTLYKKIKLWLRFVKKQIVN